MSDVRFERDFVTVALRNPSILRRAKRSGLKPEHFKTDIYRDIFRTVESLWSQVEEYNIEDVKNFVQLQTKIDPRKKEEIVLKIEALSDIDAEITDFSLEILKERQKTSMLGSALSQTIDRLQDPSQEIDDAISFLYKQASRLKDEQKEFEGSIYHTGWANRVTERMDTHKPSSKSIRMNEFFKYFEPYFQRGFEPGTLSIIAGSTGSGKSVYISNFCYLAAHPSNGLNVLYVVSENKMLQAQSRLDSIFLDRKYESLYEKRIHEKEGAKFFTDYKQEGFGTVAVYKARPNHFTSMTIESMIEDCVDQGHPPDVLLIDSPMLMKPIQKRRDVWQDMMEVYDDLKALYDDTAYNLITVATHQLRKESGGKQNKDTGDLSGSVKAAQNADHIITLHTSKDDFFSGRRRVEIVKNRDGKMDAKIISLQLTDSLRFEEEITFGGDGSQAVADFKKNANSVIAKMKSQM